MNTATNNAARLSNADILATCGDADCATSDAEMTAADIATYAMVVAEVALTAAEFKALPVCTKLVRLDGMGAKGETYKSAWNNAYAYNADGSKVKGGRPIDWKAGRFGLAA